MSPEIFVSPAAVQWIAAAFAAAAVAVVGYCGYLTLSQRSRK